jgi:hypothetical protein
VNNKGRGVWRHLSKGGLEKKIEKKNGEKSKGKVVKSK